MKRDTAPVSPMPRLVPAWLEAPVTAGERRQPWPAWRLVGGALAGLVLGLGATALTLERGWDPGEQAIGPWVRQPSVDTAGSDPYARALLARSGEVPLAPNEGIMVKAMLDGDGFRLLRTCSYRIGGAMPKARFWTLTVTDPEGRVIDNPARRFGFTSSAVLRDLSGEAFIVLGPEARPGNWIPTPGSGPMILVLRLYDMPLSAHEGNAAAIAFPAVERQSCPA